MYSNEPIIIRVVSKRYYLYWRKCQDLNKTSPWLDQTSKLLIGLKEFWNIF